MDASSSSFEWKRLLIAPAKTLEGCVQALPLLAAIRTAQPDIQVLWPIDARSSWVARYAASADDLVELEHDWPSRIARQWSLARYVRSWRPHLAVDTEGSLASALIARLSGAPCRVGRRLNSASLATRWFYSHIADESTFSNKRGDWLLAPLGIEPVRTTTAVTSPPETQEASLEGWLNRTHLNDNFVVAQIGSEPLHPSAVDARVLGWTARHLGRQYRLVTVVATSGKQGAPSWFTEAVVHHAGGHAVVAPVLHPCALMSLWQRARFVVSADPGFALLAAALGLRALGFRPPSLRPGKHWFRHMPLFMMNSGELLDEWDEARLGRVCQRMLAEQTGQDAQAA